MLELDLRLGSVVVHGYSRYNGKAPAIEGQNSLLCHSFLQKAGKWFRNHHGRTNKNFEYNGVPCWKNQYTVSNVLSRFRNTFTCDDKREPSG